MTNRGRRCHAVWHRTSWASSGKIWRFFWARLALRALFESTGYQLSAWGRRWCGFSDDEAEASFRFGPGICHVLKSTTPYQPSPQDLWWLRKVLANTFQTFAQPNNRIASWTSAIRFLKAYSCTPLASRSRRGTRPWWVRPIWQPIHWSASLHLRIL